MGKRIYTHKIVDVGERDSFYTVKERFIGKLVNIKGLKHVGGGWYQGYANFKVKDQGAKIRIFYQIKLKKLS